MTTYTESQKREALEWAEGKGLIDEGDAWLPGYCEKQGKVLAACLRSSDSKLATENQRIIDLMADLANANTMLLRASQLDDKNDDDLSALRAAIRAQKSVKGRAGR